MVKCPIGKYFNLILSNYLGTYNLALSLFGERLRIHIAGCDSSMRDGEVFCPEGRQR